MNSDELSIVEIESLDDDLLLPWFDLYETAFPPVERMQTSQILKILKDRAQGRPANTYLLAMVDKKRQMLGMACLEIRPDLNWATCWYIAIVENARGVGLGTWFYKKIANRAENSRVNALVFDVEMPEDAQTPEEHELRERRIRFYKRNGAKLLHGVQYSYSSSPAIPPIPLLIMIHPFRDLSAKEAYEMAEQIYGDTVVQTGSLILE
jgi:GNAT superfamily N-acetyltransferase